jgi:predicted RNase H-like nuclease (RuvC/YqgF family)
MELQEFRADKPDQIRQCLPTYVKERNRLIHERDALVAAVKSSAAYKENVAKNKLVEKELRSVETQYRTLEDKEWDRFLARGRMNYQSKRPYYDMSGRFGSKTNILQDVLSAIATVAPLSKLTSENIKGAVEGLARMAIRENKKLSPLSDEAHKLRGQRDELNHLQWKMERGETDEISALNTKLWVLNSRIEKLNDMLANPQKYMRRVNVQDARQAVKLNIDKIYADFLKREAGKHG